MVVLPPHGRLEASDWVHDSTRMTWMLDLIIRVQIIGRIRLDNWIWFRIFRFWLHWSGFDLRLDGILDLHFIWN